MTDLNALAARVHAANKHWWQDLQTAAPLTRNYGEMFMLVVSEIAEAMEGHRKGLMDDKLPHRPMIEVEIADAYIRLLDIAGHDFPGGVTRDVRPFYQFDPHSNIASELFRLTGAITRYGSSKWTYIHASILLVSIEHFAETFGLDLAGAFEEKMAYNATRRDHTREARLAEGGKKY